MMKKTFLYSSLFIFLLTAFGCGENMLKGMEDKDSDDAKQYAALKSLDSGSFGEVLAACDEGKADPLDCSAAALGAAGLDPLEVARQLNDQIDSLGTTAEGDISAIGTLPNLNPDYLDEIHDANLQLADECETTGDEDVCSQLVVTSMAEVVMAIAQVGETDPTIDLTDGISDTEAVTIAGMITATTTVLVDTNDDGILEATPIIDVITDDALYIINNINDSPFGDTNNDGIADTELGQVVEEQVEAIGGADCASDSTVVCDVSATDLESYLKTQYAKP